MKLKIICGQLEITPGRPDVNYKKIIDAIGGKIPVGYVTYPESEIPKLSILQD
mgnify:FL=1